MTINPRTNAVELSSEDVRKAIVLYLEEKFKIYTTTDAVNLGPVAVEVWNWNNDTPDEDEQFRINQ